VSAFDIVVPTFNRYKELPVFFAKNCALKDLNIHLWIIDDCSPDFDSSIFPEWKNLTVIRLPENKGQAFGRNVAITKGEAPFVISLDDDAWFEDCEKAIKLVEESFDLYPDAGCVMFNVATPNSDYSNVPTGTILPLHVTCGCAYRKGVLSEIEGFSGFLHSGAEETDISLKIYRAGWNIRFSNEIKVFHNFSPVDRTLAWHHKVRFYTARNDLLIVLMYYPPSLVIPFIIGKFVSHLKFAISYNFHIAGTLLTTFKAFVGFLLVSPTAMKARSPLTSSQFSNWRKLKYKL
jgi:glycosyltransferase involved in cell wall biosynthesis